MSLAGPAGQPRLARADMDPGEPVTQPVRVQPGGVRGMGNAEIDDPRPVVREQDIRGLEVPVHHAHGVNDLPAPRPARPPVSGAGRVAAAPAGHRVGERRAVHEGGNQPWLRPVHVGVHTGNGEDPADGPRRHHLPANRARKSGSLARSARISLTATIRPPATGPGTPAPFRRDRSCPPAGIFRHARDPQHQRLDHSNPHPESVHRSKQENTKSRASGHLPEGSPVLAQLNPGPLARHRQGCGNTGPKTDITASSVSVRRRDTAIHGHIPSDYPQEPGHLPRVYRRARTSARPGVKPRNFLEHTI